MRAAVWSRIISAIVIVMVSLAGRSTLTNAQEQQNQYGNRRTFVRDVVNTDTKAQPQQQGQNKQQPNQRNKNTQPQQPVQQQPVQNTEQPPVQKNKGRQNQQWLPNQEKQPPVQQQQQPERFSPQSRQQPIEQNQQNMTQYRQHVDAEVNLAPQRTAQLQQQKRTAQYRYQQQYSDHLRQQQLSLQNDRSHDYNNDPRFSAAPSYRYKRGDRYYEINQYGADLLRQAVNYGYAEGFRAGEADRKDHWRSSYQDSFAYQDANYGYNGYYIDQDTYNYYFREGFRRGYEDGYHHRYFYSRNKYGRYSKGTYSILDAVLKEILSFQPLQ
jgi:hypothetical protein